jgi:MFS family permease
MVLIIPAFFVRIKVYYNFIGMRFRKNIEIKMPEINKSGMVTGGWLIIACLFFAGGLNYLDRTMLTTMRASIVGAMPMSETQFGLLTSIFLWVYGLFSPFAGYLADRFTRSRVILFSLFSWSVITLLTAWSTTYGELLLSRVLLGITQACYIPASLALISDYHRGTTRSFATGISEAGVLVGSSLGFTGGWIAEQHEWNTAFIIFGSAGIIYSFILMFFLRDIPENPATDISVPKKGKRVNFLSGISALLKDRSFLLLLAFWGLLGIVGWLVIGWLPTYYKENFNLSQGMAGLYATGYLYPASIAGLLLGGFLADRWSRSNPFSRIYVPVIGLCIAAPCIFFAANTTILPLAITFFVIYGITRVFSDANLMPVLCMVSDPHYRATGFGVLNFFSCIIGGLGLYAGGVLRDSHVDLGKMYQFAGLIILVCAFFLFLVKPKKVPVEDQLKTESEI